MARSSRRTPTEDSAFDVGHSDAAAEAASRCPYCKKELVSAADTACPHCGLPIRRRRRRQMTAQIGAVAKLVLHRSGQTRKEYSLLKQTITLGRHPDSMIRIESPFVSNHHARLDVTDEGHTLTDLNSTNGTRLNGHFLTPDKAYLLTHNDIIRLSDRRGNSIQLTYLAPSSHHALAENKAGHSFQLHNQMSHIGRGFDADIVLSHPAVSWYHAKISKRGEQYLLEDISTHNDTFLNGLQLQQTEILEQGDVIGIGPFNLIYQGEGQLSSFVAERNFNVEVSNLEKIVYGKNWLGLPDRNQPKKILRQVDIDINPREFVALVGGSGSGKSTLMRALLGLSPATGGNVLVNGDDLYENLDLYRHLIGYVPQDDIIHHNLTVRRALTYAFQLRSLRRDPAEVDKVVDEVLTKVDLTAHAETLVRDLSGGQRKRVSIAAELLADPWIFFLDEPTSGLDPGLEKLMMDTLRQLADEGRTIVLVTHATSHIINHCDQVAFLARGELAYFGPPNQVLEYFDVDNFPDIYTVLSQPEVNEVQLPSNPEMEQKQRETSPEAESNLSWGEQYRQSDLYETYISHRRSGQVARPLVQKGVSDQENVKRQGHQFKLLMARYLELIKANRLNLGILLAVMPLIAIFLMLIIDRAALVGHAPVEIGLILETGERYSIAAETQTVLFMMALAATLLGIFSAAYEIISEASIYRRERMIGLGIMPYFASKFVVLALFMALQLLLFLAVLALKSHFPGAGVILWAPLEYYITLLLAVLASIALGLFISALASSKDLVTYLVLIVVLFQIVFSGAIFELPSATQPLSFLTITRWSLESLGITTDIERLNQMGQLRVESVLDTGRGLQTLIKDVPATIDFYVNYTRNPAALISRWVFLMAHILIWSRLAIWQIGRKDEI